VPVQAGTVSAEHRTATLIAKTRPRGQPGARSDGSSPRLSANVGRSKTRSSDEAKTTYDEILEGNEMDPRNVKVPSVSDYIAAFRALEPRITPKQRELLLVHHAAPARVISATRLAEAVGFDNYNAVNLQYGLLGAEVARELNIDLGEFVAVGIMVEFVEPAYAANEHFLWVLRQNVAQALEDLGWARRVSHLLYPEFAFNAGS